MKIKQLKQIVIAATTLLAVMSPAKLLADGGISGGGGDPLEIKFQEVALNIQQWVEAGHSKKLLLPSGMSVDSYDSQMLEQLKNYEIVITEETILVHGQEKTCENFWRKNQKSLVICNRASLQSIVGDANSLYQLIHHEFASLARIEVNVGSESDYFVSKQLSAYLRVEKVLRLPTLKEDSDEQAKDMWDEIALGFLEARFPNEPGAASDMQYYYEILSTKHDQKGVRKLVQVTAMPDFKECFVITMAYDRSFSSAPRSCKIPVK